VPRIRKIFLALTILLAFVAAACGSDGSGGKATTSDAAGPRDTTTSSGPTGTITVSAAASLTESFTAIGKAFEAANPGTTVRFTFDSSSTLAQQIVDGAPVDVFASADEKNMAKLTDADAVSGDPTAFARNRLVIVTKPGNPLGIDSLADLADLGDEVVALCAEDVPCGKAAATALGNAGVTLDEGHVTRGQNVKATLAAVTEGDAAAGVVYVTDAEAAGDAVTAIAIPDAQNALATYPIAVLADAGNPEVAAAFVAYVTGPRGQATLRDAGFLPPS
jgi:molybdate transport system substrate-binding protein